MSVCLLRTDVLRRRAGLGQHTVQFSYKCGSLGVSCICACTPAGAGVDALCKHRPLRHAMRAWGCTQHWLDLICCREFALQLAGLLNHIWFVSSRRNLAKTRGPAIDSAIIVYRYWPAQEAL